ncbi:DNA helicase RecQ [Sulfurospirillum diekertiae]|uniref:DNA helicase RecQ n=1 Tax=Sulfurospirillum diekertiae TaxID=1854492 RepID=A0A6G9VQS9_9BACT|nr:DNA helicase RecQ [Sulfurospirillum diekertiae]QIR75076.1 DNA helicase RecQ [Sulfurospirillum diekertiae]QIR77740.1 DNA helicase RecQ [Sulfurospirillum diekertiae]
MTEPYRILQSVFGHHRFRAYQEEAVNAILAHKDIMMILPTGAGKSLCYQLPSLVMEGLSVVISPLLALMHDQITALSTFGIKASMISSMQSPQEIQETMQACQKGEIKLLYVAPERLKGESFLHFLQTLPINFFVIDEAHCVSEWGHEFREDYRQLFRLKLYFPQTPIAAFTATATKIVEHDILHQLSLSNPLIIRAKVERDNLTIKADYRNSNGREQLLSFLSAFENESGIIYTLSRKETESLAQFLSTRNILARAYHAGLPTEEKNETFRAFLNDEIQVVVATIAFGMGIDKSNIRFVVHMSLPKTIENYYQEIGRAGRDGLPSSTLLLFSNSDIVERKRRIGEQPASEYQTVAYEKLEAMAKFASSQVCRHQQIASYFDDTILTCKTRCDNCIDGEKQSVDISYEALKLLSSVYRTGQRFGLQYVVDVLMGANSEKIEQNGHQSLSVFGIGNDKTKAQWLSIGDRLLELGALNVGEYRVVSLSEYGAQIIKERLSVSIHAKRLEERQKVKKAKKVVLGTFELSIFEKLRALRSEIAKENGIPPYVVFSDKTLKEMAEKLPLDKEAMLEVSGVGEVKFERYGEAFLELCEKLS